MLSEKHEFENHIHQIKDCKICEKYLPLGANPVFSIHPKSKILIIGQAPGTRVHATGIPWNDPSGDNLRNWLGMEKEVFYDPEIVGIMPMGFCYPGRGKGGDLPPRPECAPKWYASLLDWMPNVQLTLLIGAYAQKYYLGASRKKTLTETVKSFEAYSPDLFPLVHPSPRNRLWMRNNTWFESEVVPQLRKRVCQILG